MDLIVQGFEEINIERPQMVAKLLVNLEQGMKKANKQEMELRTDFAADLLAQDLSGRKWWQNYS